MGLWGRVSPEEVRRQQGIGEREQVFERLPLPGGGVGEGMVREPLEDHVQLLHASAATPQQPPRLRIERG
ncbi:MAG TPA: hypothetical protein VH111_07555 [Steroidobacteraceae bacterium]|nr:hypothetical protein [Steroidobacteraceae bacterium]